MVFAVRYASRLRTEETNELTEHSFMSDPYTIIIGLEVHVQLLTESKMFCGCGAKFGEPPNTQTCPVCIGLPGALPVINRRAFELALKTAVALNCEIARFTKWDRKNYYYPDLPKGYQISQFDLPIGNNGWLEIEGRRINILRAHLEEDAGKSMHDEGGGARDEGRGDSGQRSVASGQKSEVRVPSSLVPRPSPLSDSRIDLNRAGTPLLEIVSQPDLRTPSEAKAYLTELKLLLNYLGVSDCNMQEGSLRVDANINLHIDAEKAEKEKGSGTICAQHPPGRSGKLYPTPFPFIATPIVEVKNMNSFRAVERALAYEAERQWRAWQETGRRLGDVPKSTRGWDEASQTTRPQRSKEESSDYRYFPDPDLVPVTVAEEAVERVRASLGELPAALRTRLEQTFGITPYDAEVLVNQGGALVDYFIELAEACGDGKAAGNWVQQDVLRWLGEQHVGIDKYPVPAKALAELIGKVRGGAFDTSRGREVLGVMVSDGKSLAEAIQSCGIAEIDDATVLELCRRLVLANPKVAAEVREGKLKGLGALIGQAKRENSNVNPNRVRELCLEVIQWGEGRGTRDEG
jgi:aspartyl-tRNA(Asn)/glutamyl-tRNA(Gln) amidotransferase subunit B